MAVFIVAMIPVSLMVFVGVAVLVVLMMRMVVFIMLMFAAVFMMVFMDRCKVDIKLDAGDALAFLLADVEVENVELKFLQLARELVWVNAEVEQCADEHVAADAAKDVEVKRFHFSVSALIWLAA